MSFHGSPPIVWADCSTNWSRFGKRSNKCFLFLGHTIITTGTMCRSWLTTSVVLRTVIYIYIYKTPHAGHCKQTGRGSARRPIRNGTFWVTPATPRHNMIAKAVKPRLFTCSTESNKNASFCQLKIHPQLSFQGSNNTTMVQARCRLDTHDLMPRR